MKYEIRYIESGVDVNTDSKLLDMLLETDKVKLRELSAECMCKYTRVDNDGRAYIQNRGDYAYTFKAVECDSLTEVLEKYNAILHNGARVSLDNIEFTIFNSINIEAI